MKWIEYNGYPRVEVDLISDFEKGPIRMPIPIRTRIVQDCDFAIKFINHQNKYFQIWEFETEKERDEVYEKVVNGLKEAGIIKEI